MEFHLWIVFVRCRWGSHVWPRTPRSVAIIFSSSVFGQKGDRFVLTHSKLELSAKERLAWECQPEKRGWSDGESGRLLPLRVRQRVGETSPVAVVLCASGWWTRALALERSVQPAKDVFSFVDSANASSNKQRDPHRLANGNCFIRGWWLGQHK